MATIHYARTDEFWRKQQKYDFLEQHEHVGKVDWQVIAPDKHHLWLTEGMHDEFETFLPMGTKEIKANRLQIEEAVFKLYSNGNDSGRDSWVYNFYRPRLLQSAEQFASVYNSEVDRWFRAGKPPNVDDFVIADGSQIKWTRNAKRDLRQGKRINFPLNDARRSLYRPYTNQHFYSGKIFNKEVALFPLILPTQKSESENRIICVSAVGHTKPFHCLATNLIVDLHLTGDSQCFPFYTYAEDGSHRRENITDWSLEQFRTRYPQSPISKWDIFHYVYALLHHPDYRSQYAANLRRELPRIPFVQDFWGFAQAGAQLAEIHVNYEKQPEYRLNFIENVDKPLNWRVERMKLSKDKRSLVYNDFLTLDGIPPQVFDYKLGNRSALDWIVDQYQVGVDTRSGITNDPNNADDPQMIVRLIGQVITVSLATVQIINKLPRLRIVDQNF